MAVVGIGQCAGDVPAVAGRFHKLIQKMKCLCVKSGEGGQVATALTALKCSKLGGDHETFGSAGIFESK